MKIITVKKGEILQHRGELNTRVYTVESGLLHSWSIDQNGSILTQANFIPLIKRIFVLQKRIIMLMSASAYERYEHFVETYPDIMQRVPQRMIASYLSITPEALSKVKGDKPKVKNITIC